jgi:cell division protein FtsW
MTEKLKKYFIMNTILIVLVGIIMVYSASYIFAKEVTGSANSFVFKQIIFLVFGSLIAFLISKTKLNFWYKHVYKINMFVTSILFLTMTPLGLAIKGSKRWLSIGGFNIQPGEFVKYAVMASAICYFNNFKHYSRNDRFIYSLNLLIPLALLVLQPDFGTFSITAILIAFICFISDFPRKLFYAAIVTGVTASIAILISAPYRVKRLLVFLDPWADPQNSGFQIIQSFLAFAHGHIFGQGIGNSTEKLFYLPEMYNDFIFSVIGEEVGLLGVIFVISLYLTFLYLGFRLALTVKSKINTQLISGIIFAVGFQAFFNMAVVLGLLPTKGLNLPFISYGGSSLVANLIAIGLMFSALATKSQIYTDEEIQKTFTFN